MVLLYKVVAESEWRQAEAAGEFSGAGIDLQDGFIHLSGADQVVETVSLYFAGVEGLVLVAVDGEKLGESLKWEASRDGAQFPHVYGTIPISAVVRVSPLPIGDDGAHVFPEDL